uniref:Cytochrome c oxidase subunit 6C n=1 Tax=Eptatretus burgeri TaxID=7764 RepID=A0A8C4NC40_EPTBU
MSKPVMRGLLAKRLRFHMPIAFVAAFLSAAYFKRVRDPKTQLYHVYYKTQDPMKIFESMREKGLFQSAPPTKK